MDDDIAFVEREDYEKGFAAYFDREIKPYLADLEAKRLALLPVFVRRRRWAMAIGAVIGLPLLYFLFGGLAAFLNDQNTHFTTGPSIPLVGLLILGLALGNWMTGPVQGFRSAERSVLLPKIAGFFSAFTYEPTPSVSLEKINGYDVVPGGSAGIDAIDGLSGTYNGTRIEMCQLTTWVPAGKRDQIRWGDEAKSNRTKAFSGFLVTLSMPARFKGVTLLLRGENAPSSLESNLERVSLEDPDFKRRFTVYADDQVETRVILSPDMMERIKRLSDLHARRWLQCGFVYGTLYIAIGTSSQLFRGGSLTTSVYADEEIHAFLARMHAILGIVDVLQMTE